MQAMLSQLNSVPGVVGSMAFDAEGAVLGRAFPPSFGESALAGAAALLANRTPGLEAALGSVGTIDLHYASARIVVNVTSGARLFFLCAPSINLQLLTMSAAGALRRLDALAAAARHGRLAAPAAGGQLYELARRIDAVIERTPGDHVKLRGRIALKAGFALDLIDADTPDDPSRLASLKAAASAVLGQAL